MATKAKTGLATLLDDARAAGWTVAVDGRGATTVYKEVACGGRTRAGQPPRTRRKGLFIYDDGTAFVLGIDLGIAAGIRSLAAMRRVLEIPEAAPKLAWTTAHKSKCGRFWCQQAARSGDWTLWDSRDRDERNNAKRRLFSKLADAKRAAQAVIDADFAAAQTAS